MSSGKRATVRLHVAFCARTNSEVREKVARLRVAGMTIDTSDHGLGAYLIDSQDHIYMARGETAETNLEALKALAGYTIVAELRLPPVQ